MTTQPGAGPTEGAPASQTTKPLRELGALVLLGANAVFLFVAALTLLYTDSEYPPPFSHRAAQSFDNFVNLTTVALPFVAVLLVTHVQPLSARAKVITVLALVEYAVSAFFGVLFGVLIGLVGLVDHSVWAAFLTFLSRAAWLALLGVAGFVLLRIWRAHFHVPRPQPQPGVYGQPQPYGYPGYPQQGGYPQQYGQPYGQPQYGAPYPAAPQSAPPAPQSAPPAGQPSPFAPPAPQQPSAAPQSAPPAAGAPSGVEPTQMMSTPSGVEPTQTISTSPGVDQTQAISTPSGVEPTQAIRPLGQPPTTPGQEGPDSQRTQVIKPNDPS